MPRANVEPREVGGIVTFIESAISSHEIEIREKPFEGQDHEIKNDTEFRDQNRADGKRVISFKYFRR